MPESVSKLSVKRRRLYLRLGFIFRKIAFISFVKRQTIESYGKGTHSSNTLYGAILMKNKAFSHKNFFRQIFFPFTSDKRQTIISLKKKLNVFKLKS